MEHIHAPSGNVISSITYGDGPPLVLVHGSFSDHHTNWQEAESLLARHFSVTAIARRGRGESSATSGHSVEDEAGDVAALIRHIGQPVFLLGHSYGALCALEAAALIPSSVRKLALYEAPNPEIFPAEVVSRLQAFAARGEWDTLVETFMRDVLQIDPAEIAEIRATPFWDVWTEDAQATTHDLTAANAYRFDANRFRALAIPTLLLIGAESPRELYVTDALAATLPDARIHALAGQAHEGMTTAPEQFVDAIAEFLLVPSLAG